MNETILTWWKLRRRWSNVIYNYDEKEKDRWMFDTMKTKSMNMSRNMQSFDMFVSVFVHRNEFIKWRYRAREKEAKKKKQSMIIVFSSSPWSKWPTKNCKKKHTTTRDVSFVRSYNIEITNWHRSNFSTFHRVRQQLYSQGDTQWQWQSKLDRTSDREL